MKDRRDYRRRGGSLVFPIILIVAGVLFLLDNLNIISGIDWGTIWKLWPILLIAMGLEVILGRRVSFGAVFVVVILVIVAGAIAWGSVVIGTGERELEHFSWPMNDYERAELDLDLGVGELQVVGYEDMADLMVGDLQIAPGADVDQNLNTRGDVARGWVSSEGDFISFPQIFGNKSSKWELLLNERVPWQMRVHIGVGEARLDLADLRVGELNLDWGVGAVDVTLPRRGIVQARIDGGIGDLRINVPEGVAARFRIDRGLSDLTVGSRFERHDDYYETEGFDRTESYIDLEIDIGIGSVTVR